MYVKEMEALINSSLREQLKTIREHKSFWKDDYYERNNDCGKNEAEEVIYRQTDLIMTQMAKYLLTNPAQLTQDVSVSKALS